jgi:hypothetical protein
MPDGPDGMREQVGGHLGIPARSRYAGEATRMRRKEHKYQRKVLSDFVCFLLRIGR